MQNRPIHNIAGLGEPNGERPFRVLPRPMGRSGTSAGITTTRGGTRNLPATRAHAAPMVTAATAEPQVRPTAGVPTVRRTACPIAATSPAAASERSGA